MFFAAENGHSSLKYPIVNLAVSSFDELLNYESETILKCGSTAWELFGSCFVGPLKGVWVNYVAVVLILSNRPIKGMMDWIIIENNLEKIKTSNTCAVAKPGHLILRFFRRLQPSFWIIEFSSAIIENNTFLGCRK